MGFHVSLGECKSRIGEGLRDAPLMAHTQPQGLGFRLKRPLRVPKPQK